MNAPSVIPAVAKARPLRVPAVADRRLRNGLRVIAVKRSSVPRAEIRLRIPAGLVHDTGDGARARLLPDMLLAGTKSRSSVEIARELQRLGGSLDAHADADDLVIHGGVLVQNMGPYLGLLGEIVSQPSFPTDEIAVARDRLAQEIIIRRSQPSGIAAEALDARVYGKHRYGRGLPRPDAVRRMGPAPLRTYHAQHVAPRGSTLVVVGDLSPQKAGDFAEQALGIWRGRPAAAVPSRPAPPPTGLPTLIVDRPGSVQTNVRFAGRWVPRGAPNFYALALAHTVFGGYFSSRLVKNIREDKGYTYSPGSAVDHRRGVSTFIVAADVGTEVTGPSLLEIHYELGRMALMPVGRDELDAGCRYLAGITMLSTQTQAGLASYLDQITAVGLGIDYLRDFRSNLERVTTDDVLRVSAEYLSPKNLVSVLVGDARAIRPSVEALGSVEVARAPSPA
ncbi:MAG: M16 family metallopeptidase [Actinomycetota bacterium]